MVCHLKVKLIMLYIVKKCVYHLRNIGRIRHHIGSKTSETLVQGVINSLCHKSTIVIVYNANSATLFN